MPEHHTRAGEVRNKLAGAGLMTFFVAPGKLFGRRLGCVADAEFAAHVF